MADIIELMVKKLNAIGYEVTEGDDLEDARDEAEQSILNYCHISSVPDALNYAWRDMACGCFLQAKMN